MARMRGAVAQELRFISEATDSLGAVCVRRAAGVLPDNVARDHTVNDLAFNLPLLFLFIALAVLALEVPLTAEPPMHLPESICGLMPLHYPPTDEPK